MNKKISLLKIIKTQRFNLQDNISRERIYFKYSESIDFPIDIISKKNNNKKKAIIICLQGANSGAHLNYNKVIMPIDYIKVSRGSGHAIYAANHDCIGISYERIGYGERREKNNTKFNDNFSYNIDPSLSFMLYGKTLIGESINELNSLIKYVKKRYEDLPIYIMGYSDGGALAMVLASMNKNIDGIAISGCIGLFDDTINKRSQTGFLNIPNFLNFFDMNTFIELILPRYCLIISATNDHIWPYKLSKKLLKELEEKNSKKNIKLKFIKVEGGHSYYSKIMWKNLMQEIKKMKKKIKNQILSGKISI